MRKNVAAGLKSVDLKWLKRPEHQSMARVVSRQTIVRTAEEFAKTGADACPGIQFIHVSKTEVEESMGDLDDLAFSGARHLPGIRNVHHMEIC